MTFPRLQRRTLTLAAVIAPLLALFVYVALRSRPLAPVAVTVATAEARSIEPALSGIGTVQARYTYRIGPTSAGRIKRLDAHVGDAIVAGEDVVRLRAELEALRAQRGNLSLVAPVAGLVAARDSDPGTTVVAGQSVIELIDPASLWIDARFDQISADGLAVGLPAQIVLRSRHGRVLNGRVLRVEPRADAVTEETLAKIVFEAMPTPLPPVGELAEVTVQLPGLPPAPTIPNAAIRTVDGERGVWKLAEGDLSFAPLVLGPSDLDGRVQVHRGLAAGDQVIVHGEKALTARSRIRVADRLPGVPP